MNKKRMAGVGLLVCFVILATLNFLGAYPPCLDDYPDWKTSPYLLPYPVGENYPLYQGNCTLGGHHGPYRYSYDFLMDIGTVVTAARGGIVFEVRTGSEDGGGSDNLVKIQHEDGTIAAYSHIHDARVAVGEVIEAGDPIAWSGNTGKTGGTPHLHFQVSTCSEPVNCGTLPVTFRNAGEGRLREGEVYEALAVDEP